MPRIFIAIAVDTAVRALAAEARAAIEARLPATRRIAGCHPDDLHLTLAFLGEVPQGRTAQVAAIVARIARSQAPIDLEVAGVGAFPRASQARVVWLGVRAGHEALARLAHELGVALRDTGFEIPEAEWTGHITLLRVRERGGLDVRAALAACTPFSVTLRAREICLMESRPAEPPPHYRVIFRAPITGETALCDV